MVKSNINITSNIYIRSNQYINEDKEYIKKITGANLLRKIREQYTEFQIPFTYVQQQIAKSSKCSMVKNGEMSHGPVSVNGVIQWVNRCEYTDCPDYDSCTSDRNTKIIPREPEKYDSENKKSSQEFFEAFGIIIQNDTVVFKKDRNTTETEESSKKYIAPTEQDIKEIKESEKNYIEITEPDCIISSPIESHIILNSGPGTGKTYTIIQRLIYILANNLCSADEIYILCYTRSAKKVIENKIEQAVVDGIIQPSAKNICILTFDSYATYFLMEMKDQRVITEKFENYDYNKRISLFNKYILPEDFNGISYFIVDEIQDLVNERAEMVLKILHNLNCGYLLAGDRCQSIYDYTADDDATLDSVEFYKRLEERFPDDILRYEITINKRQTSDLAEKTSEMRKVLLNKSFIEQNEYANDITSNYSGKMKIEKYIRTLNQTMDVSTAILCRNNGEAEYISSLLCKKKIRHTLNRGVNNIAPLPRWIADVFWDYCYETISRKDFIERFNFRCDSNLKADILWEHLCKLTKSWDKTVIDVSELVVALTVTNNIPIYFYEEAPLLTVSTIHKAKGSEFDKVILIESDIKSSSDSAEEARIRYVALTRPKKQFIVMKKNTKYFKRTMSGRVIETGLHNIYKTSNKYCKCITIGLIDDIDSNSFVLGDFDSAIDLQEYIIHNIKLYDKLSAKRSASTGLYDIYHNGHCIGVLSKIMNDEINRGVEATDYKYNLPDNLENFYVSGITTEILKKSNADIPGEYKKSKICFGIRITGLAKLNFKKE